jgi:hypothetical protein
VALVVSTGTVGRAEDDTMWDTRFGSNHNSEWETNDSVGWGVSTTKSGSIDFRGISLRFTNMSPTIPPRSKITRAVVRGTADGNQEDGTLTSIIECLAQDGFWDATPESSAQWLHQDHGNHPADFRITVKDSNPTVLTDSHIGSGNNFLLPLRQLSSPARFQRHGQSMEIETAGTLDTIDVILAKVGAPTGNIWLEIYDQDGSGFPDSLLATSDLKDVSTLTVGLGTVETFVFSGGDQYVFSLAEKFVVVVRGDWTVDGTNYVESQYKQPVGTSGGYTLGKAMTYGNGVGFDDHHYSTDTQALVVPSAHPTFFIFWDTPNFTSDVEYETPDLSEIVQAYVNSVAYNEGDPFAIQIQRLTLQQNALRAFKGFLHADTPGVSNHITLEIEWRERAVRVSA